MLLSWNAWRRASVMYGRTASTDEVRDRQAELPGVCELLLLCLGRWRDVGVDAAVWIATNMDWDSPDHLLRRLQCMLTPTDPLVAAVYVTVCTASHASIRKGCCMHGTHRLVCLRGMCWY